ncbi:hypothetical protein SVAN01_01892 [Stagonosporopsis vannaccii]|nr:hypothetical protein SVAN01_01892 [Stagonosporopsis vannaccii]
MLFQLSSIVTLLACTQRVASAAASFSLYAYGSNLPTGMKLFHADGQAYLGHQAPSFEAVNITRGCKATSREPVLTKAVSLTEDLRFEASPEGNASWSKLPSMYIGTDANDLKTVGFASEDDVPDGTIVKGFGLFGGWAYNNQNAGAIEMNFVATPANETGLYKIKWNTASTKVTHDCVPISLRTEAPATPDN